ncbi:hypothetical protein B5F78_16205 [Bacteroides sp. An279]|nr:hypothetical protein B5F78_16205 [Bacteroides sp. An279]
MIGMAKEKQTAPVGKLGKMKAFIFLVTYKFIWCKIINLQAARLLILHQTKLYLILRFDNLLSTI